MVCDLPHACIYDFNGQYRFNEIAKPVPLDSSNLLLRGCVLRNTEWVMAVVVYAGGDTKAMLNNSGVVAYCNFHIVRICSPHMLWSVRVKSVGKDSASDLRLTDCLSRPKKM